MVSVCKTWSLPSANIVGLCSSMYDPPPGQNTCPVCAMPVSIIGPVGCCGCPSTEQFPAIWRFDGGFSIGGGYPTPEVVTTSGLACLANSYPIGGAPAVATTTNYRVELAEIMAARDLVRVVALSDGTAGCGWGAGAGKYDGWIYIPTYGSPSPPLGGCALTRGTTEIRMQKQYTLPFVRPNGTTIVGNAFSADVGVNEFFTWENVPESGYDGTEFDGNIFYKDVSCSGFPLQCFVGVSNRSWNFFLRCVSDGNGGFLLSLSLNVSGYSYTAYDKMITATHSGVGVYWVHDEYDFGDAGVCATSNQYSAFETDWSAPFPCGKPQTITLTGGVSTNPFFTFPSTITLRAVY